MTSSTLRTKAADIHDRVGHPIVDGDGHFVEIIPVVQDYIRKELGSKFDRYLSEQELHSAARVGLEERRRTRQYQGIWLGNVPADNVRDLATAMLPSLLAERMDDLGFDFGVLYGTHVLRFPRILDDEVRAGACRGVNNYLADVYTEHAARMTPAAVIPMHTPQEAIAELEHAKQLGLKVVGLPSGVMRPVAAYEDQFPRICWWDTFGLDSEYDYDPVWAKLVELGFAATFHGGSAHATQIMASRSISNSVYNHLGSHAYLQQQLCKSLFLGGVSKRFPTLTFAFLEAGCAWACQLLGNLEEYWEKRNVDVMMKRRLNDGDIQEFRKYLGKHGGNIAKADMDLKWMDYWLGGFPDSVPDEPDEFRHIGITDEHELKDLFVPNFYFGCEADDPSAAFAFSPANAFGAELKPVLSSDIGHWDVLDMEDVLPDSWRFIKRNLLTPEQYRRFTYEYPAMLHLSMNPNFFDGTRIESQAKELLAKA